MLGWARWEEGGCWIDDDEGTRIREKGVKGSSRLEKGEIVGLMMARL